MNHLMLLSSFALAVLCPTKLAAGDLAFKVEAKGPPTDYTVSYQRQKLMVYSSDPQQYKSYVKELYTTKGYNILRDSPFDHLHHHALMYGIRVNGLNFWEETPGNGVQKPIKLLKQETGLNAQGQAQAILGQLIHWVAPADAFLPDTAPVALLIEQRTLTLTLDESQQEVALRWQSEFQVGVKTNQVVLSGANYHGLGMRFLQELDALANHSISGNRPDLSGGKLDVSSGKWASVSFDWSGKPATIVLFGAKNNTRGDTQFFSMRTPFAYLSATQGLDKEPLVYRTGDRFQLNYLVTLYPELKTTAFLQERYERWEAALPPK